MSEKSQLGLLVIGGLVLGILGLLVVTLLPPLFAGNLVVDSYEATLAEDGSLQEHYTYDVLSSGQYRMLYRVWEAPLVFDSSPTQPSVEFISTVPPEDTIGYATYGFIETLQNAASHKPHGAGSFIAYLKPQSKKAWVMIEEVWAGKSSLMDVIRAERDDGII